MASIQQGNYLSHFFSLNTGPTKKVRHVKAGSDYLHSLLNDLNSEKIPAQR